MIRRKEMWFNVDSPTDIRTTGNTRGIHRGRPRHKLCAAKVHDHNDNYDYYDYHEAEEEKDNQETILSEGKEHLCAFINLFSR